MVVCFWFDNLYSANEENKVGLTRFIERFRYRKFKWVTGEKIESGKSQVFLYDVFQKPIRM